MEHVFDLYSKVNKDERIVTSKDFKELVDNIKNTNKLSLDDKWLMEIIYSFYNIGYENGIKK